MTVFVTSLALTAAISAGAARPVPLTGDARPISAAAKRAFSPGTRATPASGMRASSSRDSLKNGAIIGAVVGGVVVGLLATVGCGLGDLFATERSSCAGSTVASSCKAAGAKTGKLSSDDRKRLNDWLNALGPANISSTDAGSADGMTLKLTADGGPRTGRRQTVAHLD